MGITRSASMYYPENEHNAKLIDAVGKGDMAGVKEALSKGALISEAKNSLGDDALTIASLRGDDKMSDFLLGEWKKEMSLINPINMRKATIQD